MDSFELSKIGGAALAALLLIFGGKALIEIRQAAHEHGKETVGYVLPTETKVAEAPAAAPKAEGGAPAKPGDAAVPAAAPVAAPAAVPAPAAGGFDVKPILAKLATAKADEGKALFKKCAACHIIEKGAASKAAPNLWGVVNRKKATQPDFAGYSDAMKGKGGEWTYDNLAHFIHKPKEYVPGTKMIFNGISDDAEVANVIAYLRTLSDAPPPLPN